MLLYEHREQRFAGGVGYTRREKPGAYCQWSYLIGVKEASRSDAME